MEGKAAIFGNLRILTAERLQKHSPGPWTVLKVTVPVRCFVSAPGPAAQKLRLTTETQARRSPRASETNPGVLNEAYITGRSRTRSANTPPFPLPALCGPSRVGCSSLSGQERHYPSVCFPLFRPERQGAGGTAPLPLCSFSIKKHLKQNSSSYLLMCGRRG